MTHQSSPLEINFYFTQPPCFVFSCRSNYLYEGGLSHCDPLKDGICLSYYESPLGVRLNIYVYHSVPVANVQVEPSRLIGNNLPYSYHSRGLQPILMGH